MSVRRPLWVQRLAFVIFELTDPAGAARLRMSRGALNEAGEGPSGRRAGLDDPASLSALSGEEPRREATRVYQPSPRLAFGPSSNPGPSSPLSASGVAPGSPSQQAADLVPGLSGRAQLLLFAAVFFGPLLGWSLGVIFGVTL